MIIGVVQERSDVWAYGVVVWEVFSMGGIPYSNHQQSTMGELLATGYRMSPPDSMTPESIAVLMRTCVLYIFVHFPFYLVLGHTNH
jgi:hypothetical protein